jgi:hypothetical protein
MAKFGDHDAILSMETVDSTLFVIVGLGPTIHEFLWANALLPANSWMVVPSTTMTEE